MVDITQSSAAHCPISAFHSGVNFRNPPLPVDFRTQLASMLGAAIYVADEVMSSHNAIHGSDGLAFCIYALKVTDMLQKSRVKTSTVIIGMK